MEIKPMVLLTPNPIAVEVGSQGRAYCDKCKAVTSQYVSSIGASSDDEPDEYDSAVESLFGGAHSPVFWWRCDACAELDGAGTYATLMTVLMRQIEDSGLLRAS